MQTYQVLWASPVLAKVYATVIPSHRGRSGELTSDLRRLGELAAADTRADDLTVDTA